MTYSEALDTLGATQKRSLMRLWDQYVAGAISKDQLVEAGAVVLDLGAAQGRLAAEVSFVAWQHQQGIPVKPAAAPPIPHYMAATSRYEQAILTAIADAATAPDRLGRLALAESVESSQHAFGSAIRRSRQVEGWKRGLDADPCQLCRWWWRDGQVFPKEHPMPTHKGCTCTPIPTLRTITYYEEE